MNDALRPSTLLWGTACLWALCVLGLALAGLGGHAPGAPAMTGAAPLPPLKLVAAHSRLGSLDQYQEVGARPLLMPDRRPAPVAAAEGGSGDLDASLTSVLITPTLKLAILTDNQGGASRRVRVGETIAGTNWRLVDLQPRQALIESPAGQRRLDLRVYDGKTGAPPTPTGAPAAAPASADAKVAPSPAASPAPAPSPPAADNGNLTQEQQIEAIRQRIEARRKQLRAARGTQDNR